MPDYPWSTIALTRAYDMTLPYWSHFNELVRDVIAELGGVVRVLDAGCGSGMIAARLAAEGALVHGVDLNAEMIELAQTRVGPHGGRLTFQIGDACELPFPDESFDAVVSTNVVFAVPDPTAYLCEVRRVLRAGRKLVVSGPTPRAASLLPKLFGSLRADLERCGRLSAVSRELGAVELANRTMAATGFGWTYTAAGMAALLSRLGYRVEVHHNALYDSAAFFVTATRHEGGPVRSMPPPPLGG